MEPPEVRFASSDGLRLAYQSFGSGPPLVVVPPLASNVELSWEHELYRRVFEYGSRYLKLVQFDKRGIGLSDRFEHHPTLEQRMDDIRAVMDAEGLERASLLGVSEGGLMAQLFAAAHPERVDRLVLANSAVAVNELRNLHQYADGPLTPWDDVQARFDRLIESWGVDPAYFVDWFCPSQSANEAWVRWVGRLQRLSATRSDLQRQVKSLLALGPTDALAKIAAPTLVMHVVGDQVIPVAAGRLIADRIRDARYIEFTGEDHFLWVMPTWRDILDQQIEFVTGDAVTASPGQRRFAAVLFTDIVASTTMASQVGDVSWRETLESHDRIAWRTSDRHHGNVVKTTGDGILAIFDTPSAGAACAADLRRELATIGLSIRAGLHAGEIEVRDNTDITGLAVNIAARVEQAAEPGEILISSTMHDLLLGADVELKDAGDHALKGVEGTWRLYALN